MDQEKYNELRFAMWRKRWDAGDFTALLYLIKEAQALDAPLPQWAVDASIENLEWVYWNRGGGKKGKPGPAVKYKRMYCDARRWEAARRALESRGKAIREAAFKSAREALKGTPWGHPSHKEIEKSYNRVQGAIKRGRGFIYGVGQPPP